MSDVEREVTLNNQQEGADLVRSMILQAPWKDHQWACSALMIAARTIERGRYLSDRERRDNLLRSLFEDNEVLSRLGTGEPPTL